jgi:NAD(P)-dependent dehydrogenase (short-subunit alcohol dehydrogenase family)
MGMRLQDKTALITGSTSNIGRPIATAAVYLASEEARFVHGTVIDVDGGRVGVAVIAG